MRSLALPQDTGQRVPVHAEELRRLELRPRPPHDRLDVAAPHLVELEHAELAHEVRARAGRLVVVLEAGWLPRDDAVHGGLELADVAGPVVTLRLAVETLLHIIDERG